MKTILVLLLAVSITYAQPILTISGPASVRPGTIGSISVVLASPTPTFAATQFTLGLPTGWVWGAPIAGTAAVSAGKTISCNPPNGICVVYGLNKNVIGAGPIASIPFAVPLVQTLGSVQATLAGIKAADTLANAVAMAATGVPITISVLPVAEDLNGDGKIDALDVQLSLTALTTQLTQSVTDLQRVVNAALAAGTPPVP